MTAAQDAGSAAQADLAVRRSQLVEVDQPTAVLALQSAQAGYTAALGAAAQARLPSLAEFLH